MDRTLEESQQLDVLFEQMLASRQQQNQSLMQIQSHLTNTQGILQSQVGGLPPPLSLHNGVNMAQEEDCYDESNELEYADECEEYCQESRTGWKGTAIIFTVSILLLYTYTYFVSAT